jgi:hypothetical protein
MKRSSWSPGDLSRQKLAVRRIALRAAVNRWQFRSARRRCAAQLGRFSVAARNVTFSHGDAFVSYRASIDI